MTRYNVHEQAVSVVTDGRRIGNFDLRSPTNMHGYGHEHRRSIASPIDPNDYQRALNSMQHHSELDNDTWSYAAEPGNGPTRTSLETLWSRPTATNIPGAAAASPADVTGVTGAHLHSMPLTSSRHAAQQQSTNGNATGDVRQIGSSPVSPFTQRVTPTFIPPTLGGGRPLVDAESAYALYSADYASDQLLHTTQHQHQANVAQPVIPATHHAAYAHAHALPPGPLDINPGATRSSASANQGSYKQNLLRSTLVWEELEPWMNELYVKKAVESMGWEQAQVNMPHPTTNPASGQPSNNSGYCFVTFPTPQHAATVLAQLNSAPGGTQLMPDSDKPFVLNWASSPSPGPATPTYLPQTPTSANINNQSQKEYSIFVGDLAPETSNSDLVAVFRNPVLGLRNDRTPKFIRPFYSCKSAKIMLDPVTGVSRGYGFVRFTDEADQQRALIEMHGLYCLSRPMRISPATAKFKTPTSGSNGLGASGFDNSSLLDVATRLLNGGDSALAVSRSSSSVGSTSSIPSLTTSSTASSMSNGNQNGVSSLEALATLIAKASLVDHQKAAASRSFPSITAPLVADQAMFDESWKHQAQARAILGNLIGPNGEQLTSTDPYNTTVFVGGLSPLISEETLRTFFAPFGDIHYVKVPAGKHCGFVQFVKKVDAERAIERMQGFLIAGSRIRLSWGRSQYKAAQAAAQAAAAAQAQADQTDVARALNGSVQVTPEQALELLQKLGIAPLISGAMAGKSPSPGPGMQEPHRRPATEPNEPLHENQYYNAYVGSPLEGRFAMNDATANCLPGFSPFSPDPNYLANTIPERERPASVDTSEIMSRILNGNPQRFGTISNGGNLSASSSGMENISGISNNTERFSPTSSHSSARSATPSQTQTQDAFGFALNRSAQPFVLSRATAIRGTVGAGNNVGVTEQRNPEGIRGLNHTLASFDLSAEDGAMRAGNSSSDITSSDSSGSVQFKLSQDSGSPNA